MRISALLLVGGMMMATAQAQSERSRPELHPMPETLPLVFFSPDSLAGTMLEPLTEPETTAEGSAASRAPMAVAPEAEEEPVAVAETREPSSAPEEDVAQADAEEPPAAAEPEAAAATEAGAPAPETQEPVAATVHIIVENVESNSGKVNVAVCDTSLSREGCPYYTTVPASPGFVEVQIEDIPPGLYAVVGYHDVNDNDEFDRFLGVPREPYALSGAAGDTLVPEFGDAALKINQGVNYVIIRMRRLGSG